MVGQNGVGTVTFQLQQVWTQFLSYLPAAIGAIIVFIVGIIISVVLGSAVEKGVNALKLDTLVERTELDKDLKKGGVTMSLSRLIGRVVYWFFLIVTLVSVIGILLGSSVSVFAIIQPVVSYIPQVIAAMIILLGAVILGRFLSGVVKATMAGAKLHSFKFLSALTYYSVVVFGFIAALAQLGIATQFLYAMFVAVVAMLALAGGLAFGLGGKDYAAHLLERFREQVEER